MGSVRDAAAMNALLATCRGCERYPACPASQQLRDAAVLCPLDKWENPLPLGEWLHALAAPVAAVSDAVFGTSLGKCAGCDERREEANQAGREMVRRITGG